jgi:hypothetical protein
MSAIKKIKTKASDMLVLAIIAYLLTIILPMLGAVINVNSLTSNIVVHIICVAAWILGTWALANTSKKECGFDVLSKEEKPSKLNWILVSAGTLAFLVYCLIIDNGFDYIVANFNALHNPLLKYRFFSAYVIYAVQAIVITLIIAFAQKMGDSAFGLGKYIPYGGIFLGLCWAIANIVTSLSGISEGIMYLPDVLLSALTTMVYGIIFGVLHVLAGNKTRYALPFIALAFIFM